MEFKFPRNYFKGGRLLRKSRLRKKRAKDVAKYNLRMAGLYGLVDDIATMLDNRIGLCELLRGNPVDIVRDGYVYKDCVLDSMRLAGDSLVATKVDEVAGVLMSGEVKDWPDGLGATEYDMLEPMQMYRFCYSGLDSNAEAWKKNCEVAQRRASNET